MTSSIWAVVPAAGSGRRMASEVPKQYLVVNGVPILEYTLQALLACPDIRGVVVVLDPSDRRADLIAVYRIRGCLLQSVVKSEPTLSLQGFSF